MKLWNLYFINKVFLYFAGYIGFHVLENLLFALFLLAPLPPRVPVYARQMIAVPAGIALLYYDSWLPSFDRVIEESTRVLAFSNAYLLELSSRFLSWPLIAALLVIALLYYLLSRRYKFAGVAFVAIFAPLLPVENLLARVSAQKPAVIASDAELNAALERFKAEQASLVVRHPLPTNSDAPFDIVFLHICSLSWDDLHAVGEAENAFFKRFGIVFTQFNSATAYSGPAMIRFHHSSCGQEPHDDMYDPAAPACHTLAALHNVGFQPNVALNHNGSEGHFLQEMREIGAVSATPMDVGDLTPPMFSFDDSPIYSDYEVLAKWWRNRLQSRDERAVLYYNSITMHDGARTTKTYARDSLAGYQPRLLGLLADLDRFFADVEASGRRAVVVFLPEHGANLRGDQKQIAGMREIPSPTISIVPVGIKLIGPGMSSSAPTVVVDAPSSYLAVTTLVSRFIARDPFNSAASALLEYAQNLPQTAFVAENSRDILIMSHQGQYYMLANRETWSPYQP